MLNRKYLVFLILMLLTLSIATVEAKGLHKGWFKPRPKPKIAYLNPNHVWYNYSDQSIYVKTDEHPILLVDLKSDLQEEDHATVAITNRMNYHVDYGWNCCDIGVSICLYDPGISMWPTWACRIGEWKIDSDYDGDYEYHRICRGNTGEYYCFTLRKTTPPTDYVIIIHNSDGSNLLPITEKFWYSLDLGVTWRSFVP